ncbi:hypothetical protein [Quadrisphaera sp. DSM 44207]|uniref:DUF6941 family protein n=1 Tax=Quadrisphaera sp. DSM 44207 TaxID=1881057 RepID=UPI0008885196|nr:hypothetical protein [Quadrisphaera sp. DSM 44207]SDQ85835.1 hypothetical protein SAMN05428996_2919 [Quadrisphaera sp. DSM 44207]
MAELDYAVLADFARVDGDGTLTVVGAHRAVVLAPALPAQQVLSVAGRVWMGRREPAAQLSLGAMTPDGDIPVVAEWLLEPGPEQLEGTGRSSASFAVTVVAPLPVPGGYGLVLSVNGDVARTLPFTVAASG